MKRTSLLLNCVAAIGLGTISFVGIIVMVLNFLSGIVGGIWLAVLGHWKPIGLGIGIGVTMPYLYALVSLPMMGLGVLVVLVAEKGSKTFAGILGFLTSLYNNALIAVWVILVFGFFMKQANSNFMPYLLWSYSTMMAPLSYMASKEPPDSTGTTLGILFAQLCYFICVLFYFFGRTFLPWLYMIVITGIIFSSFAIVMAIVGMVQEEKIKKEQLIYENAFYEDDESHGDNDDYTFHE